MHKCGWVHRDISSGNILIVDGIVKIGDLEYAKRLDDDTSHAGRSVRFSHIRRVAHLTDLKLIGHCAIYVNRSDMP